MATAGGGAGGARIWPRLAVALLAAAFGVATVAEGGHVLFGPDAARAAAGHYVPFVLWFNFCAGFFYLGAAAGIAAGRPWAAPLALVITLATALVFLAFATHVWTGGAFERRTVGAMALRTGVWAAIALWSRRRG